MDTFVPPGWMTRTELVERTGKALFKDKWLGAMPTTAELPQASPEGRDILLRDARGAVLRARRAARQATSPEYVLSQWLAEMLAAQKAEEPEKAEMHGRVVEALREPLCSGVMRSGIKTRSGDIHELPPHFWQGDGPIPAFDTEEATHGREVQTYVGRMLRGAVTGRVLFERAEAEAWLRKLDGRSPTSGAEPRARRWFQAEVGRGEKRHARPKYCGEMVRQFGISKRGAMRIWDAEAPDPWKKPGRPKTL